MLEKSSNNILYAKTWTSCNSKCCWGDTESLSWAFDGIPEKSVLSITTQGCLRNGYLCKQSLLNGLHELIRIKKPEKLIVYGQFPENWKHKFPNIITTLKTFVEEKWRK